MVLLRCGVLLASKLPRVAGEQLAVKGCRKGFTRADWQGLPCQDRA